MDVVNPLRSAASGRKIIAPSRFNKAPPTTLPPVVGKIEPPSGPRCIPTSGISVSCAVACGATVRRETTSVIPLKQHYSRDDRAGNFGWKSSRCEGLRCSPRRQSINNSTSVERLFDYRSRCRWFGCDCQGIDKKSGRSNDGRFSRLNWRARNNNRLCIRKCRRRSA